MREDEKDERRNNDSVARSFVGPLLPTRGETRLADMKLVRMITGIP